MVDDPVLIVPGWLLLDSMGKSVRKVVTSPQFSTGR